MRIGKYMSVDELQMMNLVFWFIRNRNFYDLKDLFIYIQNKKWI